MLKQSKPAISLIALGMLILGLSGCEKNQSVAEEKGPAEKAGKQLDQAAARASEELSKVAEKAGKSLQEIGQKLQNEAQEAQKKE
jgi:hypothetical protein